MEAGKNDITNVCITFSLYGLMQYLLLVDEDTARRRTFYFFGDGINKAIRDRLPSEYFSTCPSPGLKEAVKRRLRKAVFRWLKYRRYPFLKTAKLYAQDWLYPSMLIGSRSYSLLSDSPLFLDWNMKEDCRLYQRQMKEKESMAGRIKMMLYGPLSVMNYGNNNQCRRFYLTALNDTPVQQGKETCVRSLEEMWASADESHRRFVMEVFDIDEHSLPQDEGRDILFITQPWVDDEILTLSECRTLTDRLMSHYDRSRVVIKRHPRDTMDYASWYPDIPCQDKVVNLELLMMLGYRPKKVVTISSSVVDFLPESIEVDWYDTHVHEKIFRLCGNTVQPRRRVNRVAL